AEARMYDERLGRFTAVDPLTSSNRYSDPQTLNRYAYTSNNPIARVDRDGKTWYKVLVTHVTYGRTWSSWVPVWKSILDFSLKGWDGGAVYRISGGENAGKWATLDPWNDRWTLSNTRAAAYAALADYRSQMKQDALGGAIDSVADT